MNPIRVGIAGLGRSGWNIHATTLSLFPKQFRVVAALDFDAARRDEAAAKFGARVYDDYAEFLRDEAIEVVVVATPNSTHKTNVIAALEAGKHAICEKPFGTTGAEAHEMIEAAKQTGKIAAPFQNRRYEGHFRKVQEIVKSGLLGEIHLIRIGQTGFSRRWDWQTLREFSGGFLNNWGPHIVDQALQVMDLPDDAADPQLWVDMRNVLSSGDAEDHIKLILRSSNGPAVDIELSSAVAYPQDRWLIAGKNGALRGTTEHLEWKWVDWSTMPQRPVDKTPTQGRSYNSEKLEWHTDQWNEKPVEADLFAGFYADFYRTVREGASLQITPQSVARQIAVIEAAKRSGGFA